MAKEIECSRWVRADELLSLFPMLAISLEEEDLSCVALPIHNRSIGTRDEPFRVNVHRSAQTAAGVEGWIVEDLERKGVAEAWRVFTWRALHQRDLILQLWRLELFLPQSCCLWGRKREPNFQRGRDREKKGEERMKGCWEGFLT